MAQLKEEHPNPQPTKFDSLLSGLEITAGQLVNKPLPAAGLSADNVRG